MVYIFIIHIHMQIHIYMPIKMHIYTNNFFFRDRTAFYFYNYFDKAYLNDVLCDNDNQLILT